MRIVSYSSLCTQYSVLTEAKVAYSYTSLASLGSSETMVPFPTDGDMLEFLLQNGEIPEKDALYATWYHSANSKAETQKALESEW